MDAEAALLNTTAGPRWQLFKVGHLVGRVFCNLAQKIQCPEPLTNKSTNKVPLPDIVGSFSNGDGNENVTNLHLRARSIDCIPE